jgi:hypothetical protein
MVSNNIQSHKLNKYDVVCKYCGQVIKGALRETFVEGDYEGAICSNDKDEYWHLHCQKDGLK